MVHGYALLNIVDVQVSFFTKRTIRAGEELTIDYNWDKTNKAVPCKCGSKNCKQWLR